MANNNKDKNNNKPESRNITWPKELPQFNFWPDSYRIVAIEKGPTGLVKTIKAFTKSGSNKTYPSEWQFAYYENGHIMSINHTDYQKDSNLPLCASITYDYQGHVVNETRNQWGHKEPMTANINTKVWLQPWNGDKKDPSIEVEQNANVDYKYTVRDRFGRTVASAVDDRTYVYSYLKASDTSCQSERLSSFTYTGKDGSEHYNYEYSTSGQVKYVSESRDGILRYEYFVTEDAVGTFVNVRDYVDGNDFYLDVTDADRVFDCTASHPWFSNIRKNTSAVRFNSEEEYKKYREERLKVRAMETENRNRMPPWGFPPCPMMCGRR